MCWLKKRYECWPCQGSVNVIDRLVGWVYRGAGYSGLIGDLCLNHMHTVGRPCFSAYGHVECVAREQ